MPAPTPGAPAAQPGASPGDVLQGRSPLTGVRICDFTGQLAGAGATRYLAAFGISGIGASLSAHH